jgi:hypothetical protein
MASTYLYRTNGTPTLGTKYTFSFWMKRSAVDVDHRLVNNYVDSNNLGQIYIDATNNKLNIIDKTGGSTHLDVTVSHKFRDPTAFHHIVIAADTTQGTAADRLKVYINGTEQTDFALGATYPAQDAVLKMNAASASDQFRIGSHNGGGDYFDGNLTHFHFIDGTAYAASTFGSTDSTSGIWKPNTVPSVTYGNNGFFLKFENSGAMGTDSSGNTNTFTVSGTMTQNVDTPSNVFATLNKLSTHGNNTLSNGNLKIAFTANTSYTNSIGTYGINTGRWYVEAKVAGATTYYPCIGFCSMANSSRRYYDPLYTAAHLGADEGTGYFAHGNIQKGGSTDGDYATFTTGDIISMYLDLESATKTMKYYKNDALIRSTTITPVTGQFYTFGATGTSSSDIVDFNFGSGFFGTTAVTSANADANGYGAFEYSPTIGGVDYYALCTKNIKEFG